MKYEVELSDAEADELVRWAGTTSSRIGARIGRQIDEQRPKPIEEGCTVTLTDGYLLGRVLAVRNGKAWVEWPSAGAHSVWALSSLKRVG